MGCLKDMKLTRRGHKIRNLKKARQNRGQTLESEDLIFEQHPNDQLLVFLLNSEPTARTSAANILGKRKHYAAIKPLCSALKIEKKLYCKIAISNALRDMGTKAITPLIGLLGEIGENQETTLPLKGFNKKKLSIAKRYCS
jgi:HEAT repeat protein